MTKVLIAPAADWDMEELLRWTHRSFGETARLRYEALLTQAIEDIGSDPNRNGVLTCPEIGPGFQVYHLWHSRLRSPRSVGRVKSPRHLLLFRFRDQETIEICRVLHDNMDIARHLPDE